MSLRPRSDAAPTAPTARPEVRDRLSAVLATGLKLNPPPVNAVPTEVKRRSDGTVKFTPEEVQRVPALLLVDDEEMVPIQSLELWRTLKRRFGGVLDANGALVLYPRNWRIFLKRELLSLLLNKEDHRYDDHDQASTNDASPKYTEVNKMKLLADEAFRKILPQGKVIQLTHEEDSEALQERIDAEFSNEFDGGAPDTYDTDETIEKLINILVAGTPTANGP